ncbi:hypothetical protein KXV22_002041 [Aspergillus fumigatus]|nr:hypothetical protein KXX38_008678 [Aspergillus fumigatus]KAH1353539.1 hypothetical protein KXX14_001017 [Aspergillus fumigatus]KAH1383654.1 hypothetical protein KXX49_005335 [Aspergillus fumigatus]KAH1451065.1 hypothetical protein KXX58_004410 [Aspergillus fumigatus]KAH1665591.1 hypothetical protein KXX65_000843 [Aspergillus fumigatus]
MSRIGGNLVEISAAASTVIGAPNAEANAYLSASVSDSLRESMGFCNQFVDVALSVLLPVNERPASSRIDFGDAGVTDVVPRRHGIGR